MKKFIALFISVAVLSFLVVGCGTSEQPGNGGDTTPITQGEPTTESGDGEDTAPVAQGEPTTESGNDEDITPIARGELEQTTFHLGHLPSTAHLLAFVAQEEGFFEDEGLEATLTQFASSGELLAGITGGQLDAVFMGSIPTIIHQSNGHDITIFGGAMTNGHGLVMKSQFIPDGFERGDIEVLRGRNIATNVNSIQAFELLILLQEYGIEIGEGDDQVNVIYFESQSDAFAALGSAEIDGVTVFSPFASIARQAGHTVVYYCGDFDVFENQPCCRSVALTSALNERPNTFIAFSRALIRAYRFSQENREETIAHVAAYLPIDPEDIEYEVYGGHAASHPDPDKNATLLLHEFTVAFGFNDVEDYDISALFNIDIYRTALEQLISENPGDAFYQSLLTRFEAANPT